MDILFTTPDKNINKPTMETVEREKMEYKLWGRYQLTKGLQLYSYDPERDLVLRVPRIKRQIIPWSSVSKNSIQEYSTEEAMINPRLIYFECLNNKNAAKRVMLYKQGKLKELNNLKEPKRGKIELW